MTPGDSIRLYASRNHVVFGHNWPIGQCGPCLDFGDRLHRTLTADAEFRDAVAVAVAVIEWHERRGGEHAPSVDRAE